MAKILVAEDEDILREALEEYLTSCGFEVVAAAHCQEAEALFRNQRPDVALIDHFMSDGTALDLLPRLRAIDPGVPVVVLTGRASIDLAVRAIKEGAEQFLTKPIELPALRVILGRLVEQQRARKRQIVGRSRQAREALDPFVGTSRATRELRDLARRVAAADSPVLIEGETGSGKGVLARWIHSAGPRAEEPFVDLNCAALSRDLLESELFGHERGAFTGAASVKPGLLEVADRGTLFLDEIGDLDLQVQPKLLKALEERRFRRLGDVRDRRVDVRLMAATHQDLTHLTRERHFRSDLYFRVSTFPLRVPALRDRLEDLAPLAMHVLERLCEELGRPTAVLSASGLLALQSYSWPGNIRELRNVLERALLLCDRPELEARDLRFSTAPAVTPDTGLTLDELERRHIERVLEEEGGRVESAARRLGVPRSTLYQRLKRYRERSR